MVKINRLGVSMPIPPQFDYANEEDFTQRFLVPLLQRLGFSLVINNHGTTEAGKDLIFAEIDRFGHPRYHGLQAKYEKSISVNDVAGLIADCEQAFDIPFIHPQTGVKERISTFYAVNAGSLSSQAVNRYFEKLRPHYGGNVMLLQGKDLLVLDRWASVNRSNVGEKITGMLLELRYNRGLLVTNGTALNEQRAPTERLRLATTSAYLCSPVLSATLNSDEVMRYWHRSTVYNRTLDSAGPYSPRGDATFTFLKDFTTEILLLSAQIEAQLVAASKLLGPIAGT